MGAPAMRDFRYGRLAPSFYGRADLGLYAAGVKEARNVYVKRMGGLTSRPGTLYKGTTKGNGAVVLVDAVFDTGESYVLEFGNQYMRVWKDGALVTVGTPAAWQTATAYTKGTVRENDGDNYVCILDHTSGASTEPGTGASWQTAWYLLTDDTFEYPTPYTTAQLSALQFASQYHVVTIVHPSHPPAQLTWLANASWELSDIDFTLPSEVPQNLAVSGTAGTGWGYAVAALRPAGDPRGPVGPATPFTRTNTVSSNSTAAYAINRSASPRTVTWDAIDGITTYVLYIQLEEGSTIYSIAVSGTSYADNGTGFFSATSTTPYSTSEGLFDAAGEYPSVVGAYQQRLLLAASDNEPDVVYASQVADPENFNISSPIVDSDSLSWRQVGQRLNRVRFFAEVAQRLVQFSSVGESIIQGDTDGILRPGEVNPRLVSQNGIAENVPPLVIGDSILYVQARGNQVMDLWPDGTGSEISRAAWDLLDGYEIVSWCFQRTPDRVVWAVRDDGKLLSLTYSREDQIVGWAWHDTDGSFERVVCVPEGDEDAVYAVVNRTIDSATVRYVERFANRVADTPACMDCAVLVSSVGLDLLGGPDSEAVTVTASEAAGVPRPTGVDDETPLVRLAEDGTNDGHFWGDFSVGADANDQQRLTFYVRADERTFISAQVGPGYANIDLTAGTVDDDDPGSGGETWAVAPSCTDAGNGWRLVTMTLQYPAPNPPVVGVAIQLSDGVGWPGVGAYQGTAGYGVWLYAPAQADGLDHLEGEFVSVATGDGEVVASPNNGAYDPVMVSGGTILLDGVEGNVYVGLPYTSDIQTLDIETVNGTRKDAGILVSKIGLWLEDTLGLSARADAPSSSTSLDGFQSLPVVDEDGNTTTDPVTGYREVSIDGVWTRGGSIFLRNVDPTPVTIHSISPQGTFGR